MRIFQKVLEKWSTLAFFKSRWFMSVVTFWIHTVRRVVIMIKKSGINFGISLNFEVSCIRFYYFYNHSLCMCVRWCYVFRFSQPRKITKKILQRISDKYCRGEITLLWLVSNEVQLLNGVSRDRIQLISLCQSFISIHNIPQNARKIEHLRFF